MPVRPASGSRLSVQDEKPADQSHGGNDAENEGNSIVGHKNLLISLR